MKLVFLLSLLVLVAIESEAASSKHNLLQLAKQNHMANQQQVQKFHQSNPMFSGTHYQEMVKNLASKLQSRALNAGKYMGKSKKSYTQPTGSQKATANPQKLRSFQETQKDGTTYAGFKLKSLNGQAPAHHGQINEQSGIKSNKLKVNPALKQKLLQHESPMTMSTKPLTKEMPAGVTRKESTDSSSPMGFGSRTKNRLSMLNNMQQTGSKTATGGSFGGNGGRSAGAGHSMRRQHLTAQKQHEMRNLGATGARNKARYQEEEDDEEIEDPDQNIDRIVFPSAPRSGSLRNSDKKATTPTQSSKYKPAAKTQVDESERFKTEESVENVDKEHIFIPKKVYKPKPSTKKTNQTQPASMTKQTNEVTTASTTAATTAATTVAATTTTTTTTTAKAVESPKIATVTQEPETKVVQTVETKQEEDEEETPAVAEPKLVEVDHHERIKPLRAFKHIKHEPVVEQVAPAAVIEAPVSEVQLPVAEVISPVTQQEVGLAPLSLENMLAQLETPAVQEQAQPIVAEIQPAQTVQESFIPPAQIQQAPLSQAELIAEIQDQIAQIEQPATLTVNPVIEAPAVQEPVAAQIQPAQLQPLIEQLAHELVQSEAAPLHHFIQPAQIESPFLGQLDHIQQPGHHLHHHLPAELPSAPVVQPAMEPIQQEALIAHHVPLATAHHLTIEQPLAPIEQPLAAIEQPFAAI